MYARGRNYEEVDPGERTSEQVKSVSGRDKDVTRPEADLGGQAEREM